MTTKFAEPKTEKFINTGGWIFPDHNGKEFAVDPLEPRRYLHEREGIINSFEYQQGIFGQYRHFYTLKLKNNYSNSCFKLCINADTLSTSNLSQHDKLCARECILSAEKYTDATNYFIESANRNDTEFFTFSLD
jgi:hypothetical protein